MHPAHANHTACPTHLEQTFLDVWVLRNANCQMCKCLRQLNAARVEEDTCTGAEKVEQSEVHSRSAVLFDRALTSTHLANEAPFLSAKGCLL
jgi:hypothetical protein